MIILFGIVGSGKSEQAKQLVSKLGCPHISTSRLLREKSNPDWDSLIMAGKLVPDEDIFSLLEPEFEKIDAGHKEFILDGAPRSIGQAKWIVEKIRSGQLKLTDIVYLRVPRELVVQRLLARRRSDDQEHIISNRFKEYDNITTPVLDYLRSQGYKINQIDGRGTIDEVEKQIWEILKDKVEAQKR